MGENKNIYNLFVPDIFKQLKNESKIFDSFNCSSIFVDISGFTAMSEKLSKLGKEGSEEVNKILNSYFENLVKITYSYGGDIYRFAGDAFFAIFKEDNKFSLDSRERSLNCSYDILKYVKKNENIKTKNGKFKIGVHISLDYGKVNFFDLKSTFFAGGKPLNKLIELSDIAKKGEIITTTEFKEVKNFVFESEGDYYKVLRRKKTSKFQIDQDKKNFHENILDDYIPVWLKERLKLKNTIDSKDGEHRKISVIFIHLPQIDYENEQEKSLQFLKNYYEIIKEYCEKYEGIITSIDPYKDGERFLIIFGFPKTYEDSEIRSLLFLNDLKHDSRIDFSKLKAGVNSDYVFVSIIGGKERYEYTVLGDGVNLAARIAAKSETGLVLVSENIFNKTYHYFNFKNFGDLELKGKEKKEKTFILENKKELKKENITRWISQTEKIIGRDQEIKRIEETFSKVKNGNGYILSISGEPGIGKSRLVEEVIKISSENEFLIFKGECFSYGSSFSYHPWIEILKEIFDLKPTDDSSAKEQKILKSLENFDQELKEWAALFGELLGITFHDQSNLKYLDTKLKKQKTFDVITKLLLELSMKKPLNIILEDFHWADSISFELFNFVSNKISDHKILLTLVYRPSKDLENAEKKFQTEKIVLKELSKEDSLKLVKNLLNIENISENFKELIIKKSQGNPFYIEELVKSLIEQGYIEEAENQWEFKGDIEQLVLPESVESIIQSRIDTLDFTDRDVIQTASVLGREVDLDILENIYENKKLLEESLKNLERFDLIKKSETGKNTYYFKHILTQEVAYGTLSFAKKEELHNRIGNFIEEKYIDNLDDFYELLSHHYFHAKNYEKSLLYSYHAGEKAKKIYANEDAIKYFTRAIDSYKNLKKNVRR
ncbi:MAG: adenylate/guanylate cyclase domain-containing protein [candidate division WOR-3 bacterium]